MRAGPLWVVRGLMMGCRNVNEGERLRILIVSYYLYPGGAIGGLRVHNIARALSLLGHDVVVVTSETGDSDDFGYHRIVVTDHARMTRLQKLVYVPDPMVRWARSVWSQTTREGTLEGIDVLLTSGSPFSTHLIGLWARETGWAGTWAVEFRDLWSDSPYFRWGPGRRVVEARMERRVLSSADGAIATTEGIAARLRAKAHVDAVPVYSALVPIPVCGTDDDAEVGRESKCLKIVHAGYLYKGRRDVTDLLQVIAELRDEGRIEPDAFEVHFYGPDDARLLRGIRRLDLGRFVLVHGEVGRDEVWRELSRADVLLVVRWPDQREAPFLPGKLFEYLTLFKPILLVNAVPGGEAEQMVVRTHAGVCCETRGKIKTALIDWIDEKRRSGALTANDPSPALAALEVSHVGERYEAALRAFGSGGVDRG